MGTQLPSPIGAHPTEFSAHVYCGQAAGWMKTPLGTEVDLGPGHTVLDRDPAPPRKGQGGLTAAAPLFGLCTVATVAHLSYC